MPLPADRSGSVSARLLPALTIALLASVWGGPRSAWAQRPPPFSRVTLYAGASAQVGANRFADFYRARPGFDAVASTPFYAGVAGAEVGLRRYEERDDRASEDFWAVPATLRWQVGLPLAPLLGQRPRLRVETSVRLGMLFMRFGRGQPGRRNESEMLAGAGAALALDLGGHWQIVGGARYEHVFTAYAVQLWQVRAGVRRTFDAPGWLQTLLR